MLKSIKFKTWFYMIGVVSIILIIMWLLGIVFLQNFYEFTKELDVKEVQVEIVKILSEGDVTESYQEIFEISRENDLFVEVFDSDGRMIISPYMFFKNGENPMRINFANMMSSMVASSAVKEMIQTGENSKVVRVEPKEGMPNNRENAIMLINRFESEGKVYYYSFQDETEREITLPGIGAGETIYYVANKYWSSCYSSYSHNRDWLVVGTTTGNNQS